MIEEEDLEELRTFDAFRAWDEDTNFVVGKIWPLSSYQFRRSVVVYASERLKQNAPIIVPKGSPINKDQVALEAGRKRGTIRSRPGFEKLIAEIDAAGEQPRLIEKKRVRNNPNQTAEIEFLKRDLDIARSRYMSLLHLNAAMAKEIRKLGGEAPQFSAVFDIQVDPNSTDVPY